MPTGHETEAASLLLRRLRADGIDGEVQGRVPERGNLRALLPGRSGRTGLVLVSHSDVVPAGDLAQWSHPPFAGVVEGGYLHGRGAADMKGTVAARPWPSSSSAGAGFPLRAEWGWCVWPTKRQEEPTGWGGSPPPIPSGCGPTSVSTRAGARLSRWRAGGGAFWAWGRRPVSRRGRPSTGGGPMPHAPGRGRTPCTRRRRPWHDSGSTSRSAAWRIPSSVR